MKTFLKFIFFADLLLIGFTAACNLVVVPPATGTPALPIVTATQTATSLPIATSTEIIPIASATPEFAPYCEAGSASTAVPQCQLPVAEESSTFCSEKDPYNLILIDKGMTYEVLTEGFRCNDAGTKGEKQMITCTGQFAADFQINVCDPSCVVPTVQAVVTQCPQGYNYNSVQGCCTNEMQVLNQNCMTYDFKTTSCVVRCFEFKREAKCKRNSWACVWNDKDKVCERRR